MVVRLSRAELARLVEWLGDRAELTVTAVEPLGSPGRSNVHYRIHAGGERLVLRRPPESGRLPTAHDVAREHAVLDVLWRSRVPVPKPVHLCTDPSVLGVPFLVTTECPGTIVKGQWPCGPSAARSTACAGLVAALAEVHRVPWRDTALREFAREEPYATRQLRRLGRQWAHAGGADDLVHEVQEGLAEQFAVPAGRSETVVHGDYGPHNVVLAPDGQVRAILDWELWTIGDPLADVAWLLALWADPGDPSSRVDMLGPLARGAADGSWPRTRLAEEYHRRTGTDLTDLPRYLALSYYKLGVIQAGIAHRLNGTPGGEAEAVDLRRRARLAVRAALDELARADRA